MRTTMQISEMYARCSWHYLVVDCHFGNKGAEEEAARSGHDGVATDPCTHAPTREGRRCKTSGGSTTRREGETQT
jgi:hypothetical protein